MNANAVLILDVDFLPLRIEDWKKVISDSFLGKLEVIVYSQDRTIKGVTRDYPMPSVVRTLRRFRRDRQAIKFSRLNIYSRDAFTCQYCGVQFDTEDLTFDHVIPRSHGGKTSWENIVACCANCNDTKANRTPAQAQMKLLRTPKKPRWLPVITVDMGDRKIPKEWEGYWSHTLER